MANVNCVKYSDWMTAIGDHAVILTHCTDWIVNYYSNERCVKIHTPEIAGLVVFICFWKMFLKGGSILDMQP